jgi:hypothetical protein
MGDCVDLLLKIREGILLKHSADPVTADNGDQEMNEFIIIDNCGRRIHADRRRFSYSSHIPERRSGIDRRSGNDRRVSLRIPEKR